MIAAVVLAAGSSDRLGTAKQLLRHGGRSLIRHTVECARRAGCEPVFVVVGDRADDVAVEIAPAGRRVDAPDWKLGMSASIRAGIQAVASDCPAASAAVLLVCDQVRLDSAVVRALIDRFDGKPGRIVASSYASTVGVPALFERERFAELTALTGPGGAKPVLARHADLLISVPWADGAVDVDRPGDLSELG